MRAKVRSPGNSRSARYHDNGVSPLKRCAEDSTLNNFTVALVVTLLAHGVTLSEIDLVPADKSTMLPLDCYESVDIRGPP